MQADSIANLHEIKAIAFDFDGVFTDNHVYVDTDGTEQVRCWRSDGLGLAKLRTAGIPMIIISTEVNPVVSMRAEKLKIDVMQGVEDKGSAIVEWIAQNQLNPKQVAFLGNDSNDIPAFREVGFPIAVADRHPDVDEYVQFTMQVEGGKGVVRELCDLVAAHRTIAVKN